jgi:hypothetical protein
MNHSNECARHPNDEETLRSDIALFESHLACIGGDDDCAYEKARIRAYELLLQERRTQLQQLLAARAQR